MVASKGEKKIVAKAHKLQRGGHGGEAPPGEPVCHSLQIEGKKFGVAFESFQKKGLVKKCGPLFFRRDGEQLQFVY